MKRIKQLLLDNMPVIVKQRIIHRDEFMRENIRKEQIGIEIGPSHHPIVSKKEGYCVDVVDWLNQEQLKEQYKNHGVDLEMIEEVDYIWKGGSYYQLINKSNYYDYVIASHVIEHTTDILGFLKDCEKLLKPEGILRLAIPDKRYCFDHFRDVTGIAEVLNNYYYPLDVQSIGKVVEYFMNVVACKGRISWENRWKYRSKKKYVFLYDSKAVKEQLYLVKDSSKYIDIHHYVFTPTSFELLISDLKKLELIDLQIINQYPTFGNEFIVTLQKTRSINKTNLQTRKKLLIKRNRENKI